MSPSGERASQGREEQERSDTVKLKEGSSKTRWQEGSKLRKYWEMRSEEDISSYSESSEEPPRVFLGRGGV